MQADESFQLILVDITKEVCNQWAIAFKDQPNVTIVHDDFESVSSHPLSRKSHLLR